MKNADLHHPLFGNTEFPTTVGDNKDGFSPHFYSAQHWEILVATIRQHQKIKGIRIGKERVRLSLFVDNMIFYIGNPKRMHQKTAKTDKGSL